MLAADTPAAARPVALITGASRRIGAHLVDTLHARGYQVVLHYHRSANAALALRDTLDARRAGSVLAVEADLAQPTAAAALIARIAGSWGRLDVLINNAAVFQPTPLATADLADWNAHFDINVRAPFLLTQAAAPMLRATRGAIINLTDIYAERPRADYAVYCASKAALIGLTKALARDLAPEVRVNAVSPGAILWHAQASADEQTHILARTPLGRLGELQDIATAVNYLLDAPYVTGQVVTVDGGRSVAE